MTWIDLLSYSTLFLATLLYAILLQWHDHRIEPEQASDQTVFKVIIGTFLVLLSVAVQVRLQPFLNGWQAVQRMALAFMIGGTPISIWQWWLGLVRRDGAINYMRQRRRHDDQTAVAGERRETEG